MLIKPKFKTHFQVQSVESVGVFLLTESDSFLLSGRAYELVAPLIDGGHTAAEIAAKLEGEVPAAEVYYALLTMLRDGYVVEAADGEISPQIAATADVLNVNRAAAQARLASTRVAVQAVGDLNPQSLTEKLASLQVQLGTPGDITLVLTDDYLHPELAAINQTAMAANRPWMLAKSTGTVIWLGPIFVPGQTACWECLAQRLRNNRPVESFLEKRQGTRNKSAPNFAFPPAEAVGLDLAATELIKWIIQAEHPQLPSHLVTFDLMDMQAQHHPVIRRPQCPVCGDQQYLNLQRQPEPILLQSRQKKFTTDGGHRCYNPEETIQKYSQHISPLTGAVTELVKISPPSRGLINLYYSGHNFGRMGDSLYFLRQGYRSKSCGKGKTDAQAQASALCEALERYSGIFQGDEIRITASYHQLGSAAIHPYTCLNFSEAQYRNRHEWNAKYGGGFNWVTEPFDETAEIEWTPVYSLTENVWKYLPTAFCYYGYPDYPKDACGTDSNGNAAGNTKEEAILQGFWELVERDSVGLWWFNRVQRPAVDLDSFGDPYCGELQQVYQSLHREFWVLDVTADFGIPVFAALSRRIDKPQEDIIFGFGAHFDPKVALSRAITEMNQVLTSVPGVEAGQDKYSAWDELAAWWWANATIANQGYLVPDANVPAKKYRDYAQFTRDDLAEEVRICANLVRERGMEMLVLDQTRPDIGLDVVKVIVPGMRHFWRRLAPGRLYDVPVQLGWLPAPLPESEMNPIPVFF